MSSEFTHPNPITFDASHRQYFSIPFGIISYITQNPLSPDGLQNLQKTCKYFYSKNKINVLDGEMIFEGKNGLFCNNNGNKRFYLKDGGKYWLSNIFRVTILETLKLNLSMMFYRCTLKTFTLYSNHSQDFPLKELEFLLDGGKLESLSLFRVNIREINGELVTMDKILGKTSNISEFSYFCERETFKTETFKNMNDVKFYSKLGKFSILMYHISEDVDFSLLCDFFRKNATEKSILYFIFMCNNIEFFKSGLEIAFKKTFEDWSLQDKFHAGSNYIKFNNCY